MTEKKPARKRVRKKPEGAAPAPPVSPPLVPGLEPGTASPVLSHRWDWPGWLLSDSINLLEGRKGAGKSSVCAAIAAHFTGGPVLPGAAPPAPRGILWCGMEENWQSAILPRLVAAGADTSWCSRLRLMTPEGRTRRLSLPSGMDELIPLLRAGRIGLIVLDPFSSLADPGIDLRIEQHARAYLETLADGLAEAGTTGLLTRHVRKGGHGDVLDMGLGSVAVGNTARTILRCDKHPSKKGRFVLSQVISNYGKRPPSLVYRLEERMETVHVDWEGDSQLSAEVLAEGSGTAADMDEACDARLLLQDLIGDERRPASTIIAEARACGVGERSLRRAKAELGVKSVRVSQGPKGEGVWYWCPPDGGWPQV